jgi:hypothetical protein
MQVSRGHAGGQHGRRAQRRRGVQRVEVSRHDACGGGKHMRVLCVCVCVCVRACKYVCVGHTHTSLSHLSLSLSSLFFSLSRTHSHTSLSHTRRTSKDSLPPGDTEPSQCCSRDISTGRDTAGRTSSKRDTERTGSGQLPVRSRRLSLLPRTPCFHACMHKPLEFTPGADISPFPPPPAPPAAAAVHACMHRVPLKPLPHPLPLSHHMHACMLAEWRPDPADPAAGKDLQRGRGPRAARSLAHGGQGVRGREGGGEGERERERESHFYSLFGGNGAYGPKTSLLPKPPSKGFGLWNEGWFRSERGEALTLANFPPPSLHLLSTFSPPFPKGAQGQGGASLGRGGGQHRGRLPSLGQHAARPEAEGVGQHEGMQPKDGVPVSSAFPLPFLLPTFPLLSLPFLMVEHLTFKGTVPIPPLPLSFYFSLSHTHTLPLLQVAPSAAVHKVPDEAEARSLRCLV